ncbi:GNAT family N-acetyltransferase [Nesterenkonia muleiensis]|uniref:GNAT family N-acetyltransferase n=1 Tax=Nesterenkonia muleiensis TaxID=2282648 RepID=UPI00130019D4|nr:GNAT family N-acetyltransferase [Nesterenkonia muleiensis]
MTGLDAHTEQIIMLAWSRILGLGDTALDTASPDERIEAGHSDVRAVSLVQLFGRTALYGPPELLTAARRIPDEELALESRLLEIARAHYPGARILGEAHLLYCEEPPEIEGSDRISVSFEAEHVRQLISRAPADDVARSGLGDAEWTAAVVRDSTGEVLAAAGREAWQEILGHIGILTHPDHRGLGLGRFAAAVATEEAFVNGLIPQWRAAGESPGSLRMAVSLGFAQAGHQTTVTLD